MELFIVTKQSDLELECCQSKLDAETVIQELIEECSDEWTKITDAEWRSPTEHITMRKVYISPTDEKGTPPILLGIYKEFFEEFKLCDSPLFTDPDKIKDFLKRWRLLIEGNTPPNFPKFKLYSSDIEYDSSEIIHDMERLRYIVSKMKTIYVACTKL